MDDVTRGLLQDLLDGSVDDARRAEAERLVATDPEAARFVAEHRALWEALGEAFDETGVRADRGFRERLQRVVEAEAPQRVFPLRRVAAVAAVLLAALVVQLATGDDNRLSAEDQQVVRYLHVLRSFDVLQAHAAALDLRYDVEVLHAFDGELENEG